VLGRGINPANRISSIPLPTIPLPLLAIQEHIVESELHRLLALTNLKAIQWIKLNHASIEFTAVFSKAEE
jgi:hypothetical protein